jgi:hypothetical protein
LFGYPLGDLAFGGTTATGEVVGLTARQSMFTGIAAEWGYFGPEPDSDTNIFFLVFVDGRLIMRLPGAARSTELIAANFDPHLVEVIPWSRYMPVPESWYGGSIGSRAHLTWECSGTDVVSYKIYRSAAENGPYSEPIAVHATVAIDDGVKQFASGATCEILGGYGLSDHTNTIFTLTVASAAARSLEITNNKDATTRLVTYTPGRPIGLFDGVQAIVSGTPVDGDEISFHVGVPHYYDTPIQPSGTFWFAVISTDAAGNDSVEAADIGAANIAIPITFVSPLAPLEEFALSYDEATDEILYSFTLPVDVSVTQVYLYSNYTPDTGTLHDEVIYDSPILTVAAAAVSGILLDTAGVPAGTYKFVAKAATASGVTDDTGVLQSMVIPYIPASLPTPYGLVYTALPDGEVLLTWNATERPAGGWKIDSDIPTTINVDPEEAIAVNEDDFQFSTTLLYTFFGSVSGTYTLTITARNAAGTRFGLPGEIVVVSDAVAPDGTTNVSGMAF